MTAESGQGRAIAIVGSGPSGCYVAQFLRRRLPEAQITVFDRLPVPYGLVRYGVAPDHQGTKAVTRQFDRLFERDGVDFAGNVEVGRDVSPEELKEVYDAVVIATGLHGDRRLGIDGEDLPGVHGSGYLTRLVNAHPTDCAEPVPSLGRRVGVIGHGNVAIDVARLLVKPWEDLAGSDVHDEALRRLRSEGVERVNLVGRSAPQAAKFDAVMVREFAKLSRVRVEVHGELGDAGSERAAVQRVEALRELRDRQVDAPVVTVAFHFGWFPERILGDDRVRAVALRSTTDSRQTQTLEVDSIVTAIGFGEEAAASVTRTSLGIAPEADPAVAVGGGVYCAGWFRRGPRGTIPQNRVDAKQVAETVAEDLESSGPSGKPGFAGLPAAVRRRAVDFAAWRRIDALELGAGEPDRCRVKMRDVSRMLQAAGLDGRSVLEGSES